MKEKLLQKYQDYCRGGDTRKEDIFRMYQRGDEPYCRCYKLVLQNLHGTTKIFEELTQTYACIRLTSMKDVAHLDNHKGE